MADPSASSSAIAGNIAQVLAKAHAHVTILDANGVVRAVSPLLTKLLGVNEPQLLDRMTTRWLQVSPDLLRDGGKGDAELRSASGRIITVPINIALMPVKAGLTYRVCIMGSEQVRAGNDGARGADTAGDTDDADSAAARPVNRAGKMVVAGRVQVIRLADITAAYGRLSPKETETARAIARAIIANRLAPADVFRETPDNSFVICFDTKDVAQAQAKAQLISLEIRERLLGFGEDTYRIITDVQEICLSEERPASDDDLIARLNTHLNSARDRFRQQKSLTAEAALERARLELSPVLTKRLSPSGMMVAQLGSESASLVPLLSGNETQDNISFQMDCILLSLTAQQLYEFPQRQSAIIIPVSFSTLDKKKYSGEYLEILRGIDEAVRGRIISEVHSLPDDIVDLKLEGVLWTIKPLVYKTIVRMAQKRRLVDVQRHRISMISFQAFTPPRTELTGLVTKTKLFDNLRRVGCSAMVRDVRDMDSASWFVATGVDFVHMNVMLPVEGDDIETADHFAVTRSSNDARRFG